jgi:glycosyltransferase involved in cell wall biosynthesis
MMDAGDEMRPEVRELVNKKIDKLDSFYIKYFPGHQLDDAVAERYIGFSMFETTAIPYSWVQKINNNCERIIVPCHQNKKAFEDSGVKVQIEVIPLGVDFADFDYIDRDINEEEDFVFGIMGGLTHRKGTDLLVKAFKHVFQGNKKAKLLIKTFTQEKYPTFVPYLTPDEMRGKDPQIIFISEKWDAKRMHEDFWGNLDCFVFPTRGEGFGLPPVEAMATGLPVIGTNWSGMEMFMRKSHSYPIGYTLVDVPHEKAGFGYPEELRAPGQQWAEPDFDDLCKQMEHVYTHRAEAKKKGKLASEWVRKNFSADVVAKQIVDYLDSKF